MVTKREINEKETMLELKDVRRQRNGRVQSGTGCERAGTAKDHVTTFGVSIWRADREIGYGKELTFRRDANSDRIMLAT